MPTSTADITSHEPDTREALQGALDNFKHATSVLSGVWQFHDGDAIASYPECLPSFDEFACEVMDMELKPIPNLPIVAVGSRVVCTCVDERGGHFYVKPGEFGTVVESNDSILRIKLERYHDGASEWDNEAVITGEDGVDLASCDADNRTRILRYFEEHYAVLVPIRGS